MRMIVIVVGMAAMILTLAAGAAGGGAFKVVAPGMMGYDDSKTQCLFGQEGGG